MEDNLYQLICEKSRITATRRLAYVEDPNRRHHLQTVLAIVNRPKTNLTELLIQLRNNAVYDEIMYEILERAIEYSIKQDTPNLLRTLMNLKDTE